MVNFEIGTKIGGGLATIVNITQPLISSLFLGNYRVGIPGYMKRFVSGDRKALLKEMGLPEGTFFVELMDWDGLGYCQSEEDIEILYKALTGKDLEN